MKNESDKKTLLPTIIEKCPICGKVFNGQSNYCELCGKTLTPNEYAVQPDCSSNNVNNHNQNSDEQSTKSQLIEDFITRSTNYFAILSIIGILLTLLPIFLDIVIGKEWLSQLLGTELGFYCLILVLLATYSGAFFIIGILILIFSIFYEEIFKKSTCSNTDKVFLSTFFGIGFITIFSLVLFILLSWISKFEYSLNVTIILTILILSGFFIVVLYCVYFIEMVKQVAENKDRFGKGVLVTSIILVGLVVLAMPVLFTYMEISNYYSHKSFDVNLSNETYQLSNDNPVIIPLIYSLPEYSGNFTFFDINYAQCHWSTNYGYFIASNKNGTLIRRYEHEIIIPKCPYSDEKIFWTYDIADYGKAKPNVRIGFVIEDENQNKNIGEAQLNLFWNGTEKDRFDNKSSIFQ